MHGCRGIWLVGILAGAVICSGSAAVCGQEIRPYRPADSAYAGAAELRQPEGISPSPPSSRLMSTSAYSYAEPGLDDRVADLEAALKAIKDKEAAAKKKAAGRPKVTAGGRIMVDWATFDQNAASVNQAGDFLNGTEFRRARIFLKGDGFHVIDYKIQMDFADNVDFKDVYLSVNELPMLGHVRMGHFKEPWSLEELTSSKYITFMERSIPNVVGGIGGRKTGVMMFDNNDAETMTWAIGAHVANGEGENPPGFQNDHGGTAVTMRYTYLPWYDWATEGRGLWHTGICFSYRDIPPAGQGNPVRFRMRPEAHLAGRVADTGDLFDVDHMNAICAETAFAYGPFSAQAEYQGFWLDRTANADPYFGGAYVFVSYFLTGEHRNYKRTGAHGGHFDRVKPFENFFRVRDADGNTQTGKGAWEIGYRWSYLDLNDNGVNGGRVADHTFGLNWYLNPYTRLMWNYVHSETNGHPNAAGIGLVDLFEMRCQIDF